MSEEPFDAAAYTAQQRASWSATAERYDALSSRLFGPAVDELVRFAGVRRGWRVLDAACGPGLASRAAARAAGEKGRVLGTDLSPGMLARAAAAPAPKRAAPLEFREMDAHALDLPDASFDAALCSLGLMLFAEPARALAELARVVVPGGPVAVMVQGRREKMLFTSLVLNAIVERDRSLRAPEGAPTLYAFGRDGALETVFAAAGLQEISTKRLSGTFRFASGEEYWSVMTEASGRTSALLAQLDEAGRAWVKKTVLRRAEKNRVGRNLEIPYEFALARGTTPSRGRA